MLFRPVKGGLAQSIVMQPVKFALWCLLLPEVLNVQEDIASRQVFCSQNRKHTYCLLFYSILVWGFFAAYAHLYFYHYELTFPVSFASDLIISESILSTTLDFVHFTLLFSENRR